MWVDGQMSPLTASDSIPPDGSAGINRTNDWEENYKELALQVRFPISTLVCN